MTPNVSVAALRAALVEAGLLLAEHGQAPAELAAVTDDSRAVRPGAGFVAVRGSASDGHRFIAEAEARGAALAIVEDPAGLVIPSFVVRESRLAVTVVGAAAHGFPARLLSLVGVTGTSGKSTTVHMLRHLLHGWRGPAASIGTLGVLTGGGGDPLPGGQGLTTPGPIELQRVLRALVEAGIRTVAMEVSSHALHQHRVAGLSFDAAVFTNLTRDHLDYHGTMEAYLHAKAQLVDLLAPGGIMVVNADEPAWNALPPTRRRITFGFATATATATATVTATATASPSATAAAADAAHVDVAARDLHYASGGSRFSLVAGGTAAAVDLPLMGDFNIANALGAAAAAWALGMPITQIASRLSAVPQVPGRLERILDQPVVLRDYAHKPDALERALDAVRPFVTGRLIVVVGCGGDRDRGKRPIMGAIAERKADLVVLTSDNPRTEDPERILDDIEAGMSARRHLRIEDRRRAIARALAEARTGDVVVLAGKGHETYQIRGTTSHPFDEQRVVHELVAGAEA